MSAANDEAAHHCYKSLYFVESRCFGSTENDLVQPLVAVHSNGNDQRLNGPES